MNAGNYALWLLSFSAEVYILVRAFGSRQFLSYLSLNLFVAALALKDFTCFFAYQHYGLSSPQYAYTYYYTDALLTVLMYLAIMHLYHQVFREMHLGKYVRGVTVGLLVATALLSYLVVLKDVGHFTGRFVVELSQNMYFVGLVLTYLLWAAVFKLRETRTRLVQLILALGIYFSGTAGLYALRNMFPPLQQMTGSLIALLGTFLPAAWAYTFTRVPEGARLAPEVLAPEISSRRVPASTRLAAGTVTNR
ncbi:MAG TPA: hypothetical protein VGS20_00470 [Candidatus Acidoferrales bacterium]|nr:hypothetical protein [Candidatus Acidoferrales bacterium]